MSDKYVGRISISVAIVMVCCVALAPAASNEKSDRSILLVDDFEDTSLGDWWMDDGGSCNAFIVRPSGWSPPEGIGCLEIFGDCGVFYQGISTDLGGFEATSFSMYIRSDTIATANAYVVLDDDSDPYNGAVAFFFGNSTPEWMFSGGGIPYPCGPRVAYQWYHLVFNFDWTARTVDVLVDGDLKHSDIPMASSTATGLDYLYLFNYQSGTAYYDFITASSPPPQPPIFTDDFESANVSGWSSSVGYDP